MIKAFFADVLKEHQKPPKYSEIKGFKKPNRFLWNLIRTAKLILVFTIIVLGIVIIVIALILVIAIAIHYFDELMKVIISKMNAS